MEMRSVPPHQMPAPPLPVSFLGDRGEFRRLVMRGTGLELLTVGFYRFWLATDIRRHLWWNIDIAGDGPEYTGRGKELLLGFLFALAILVPIYLAYFLIGLEAERAKAFASIPLFLFFYVFGQFAIYRARRYRLTRTVWWGVRFWMTGSGWSYAARSGLWAIAVILTLGLLLPWRETALERYKMRNSYYGDLPGDFDGRAWDFFKEGWWIWLIVLVSFAVGFLAIPLTIRFPHLLPAAMVIAIARGWGLLLLLPAPFLYGMFKAVEWRWWVSGVRFGDVYFESALSRTALIGLYWKVVGWVRAAADTSHRLRGRCVVFDGSRQPCAVGKDFRAGSIEHPADRNHGGGISGDDTGAEHRGADVPVARCVGAGRFVADRV